MPQPAPLEPLAFRWTALDARTRRSSRSSSLNEARNWNEFTAALARLRRARRRTSSTPTSTATSATTRRAAFPIRAGGDGSIAGRRLDGRRPSGPAGFRSTSCRTPSIRPSTSSSRPTTGRCRRTIRTRSAASGPSRTARSASPTCSRQKTRLTPDDFAAIQADTVSLHAQALLPLLLAHASARRRARPAGGDDAPASGTSTRAATAPRRRSFRRGSCELAPGDRRRRARAAASRRATRSSIAVRTSRAFCRSTLATADNPLVRRRADAGPRKRATTR